MNPSATSSPEHSLIPAQLSFAGFERDICFAFTRKTLLRGGPFELACDMIDFTVSSTRFRDPGLALLRKSMMSLAVTFFGSRHYHDALVKKGYHQYGEVLRQLNTHLALPKLQTANETLLTSLACMLLEIFLPTGPRNFLNHVRGIEAMIKLRGPPTTLAGVDAIIHRGVRSISIMSALSESRPTLFNETEWKQAPLPLDMTEGNVIQYRIFGVLAECSRLLALRDDALEGDAQVEKLLALDREITRVSSQLESIKPSLDAINARLISGAPTQSPLAADLGVADRSTILPYILYNTAYLLIIQLRHLLRPSSIYVALRNATATKISQLMELQQNENHSNTLYGIATKMAWQAIGSFESPEGLRLAAMVRKVMDGVVVRFEEEAVFGVEGVADIELGQNTALRSDEAIHLDSKSTVVEKNDGMVTSNHDIYHKYMC
ncbi:hypothetical protein NX059_007127 [Plenodomus lindquistii]|nr:hypothetical protein NX059_007127 [Plenodomus lindquistii]